MVSTPSYYLVIALALVALTRRQRALGALVAASILGISALSLHNHYHNPAFARAPDWRALNDFYSRHVRAGDVVVANYPDPAISYYYDFGGPWEILPEAYPVDREATERQLDALVQASDRVWLTPQRWSLWDDEGLVESYLDAQAERVATYPISTFQVVCYHTPRLFIQEMRPLDVHLEGGIRLLGYVVRDREGHAVDRLDAGPGEEISVTLYWRADAPLGEDYVVFAHLLDPTGWLRGQQDNQPRQGTFPTRAWKPGDLVVDRYRIALAGDAPAGAYTVEVGMYRPADGTRLVASGADADIENERVLLRGHISVR